MRKKEFQFSKVCYINIFRKLYRVSGKKVSLLSELLVGILLKIQLKAIHFF